MNLKQLFKQPLRAVPNSLAIVILVIALIGFADAVYLTIEHYQGVIPPCSITGGCQNVLTSVYSTVFGLPISLIGSIYYLFIGIAAFVFLESKKTGLLKWALHVINLGFLATLYFVYLQLFVIKSICAYCMGSALVTIILFVISTVVFSKYLGKGTENI